MNILHKSYSSLIGSCESRLHLASHLKLGPKRSLSDYLLRYFYFYSGMCCTSTMTSEYRESPNQKDQESRNSTEHKNLVSDSNVVEHKSRKRKATSNTSKKIEGSKKTRPVGFNDDCWEETEYYFERGLRKVYPYYFTYSAYCKGRWVGRPLLDVFVEEFRALPKEVYEQYINSGSLLVNGKKVPTDYKLQDCDFVTNKVHRHEVPVLASTLKIIHMSDDIVVINKPPSVPVHPCGRYRHNSVIFILAKEYGLKELHTIHRLDRLTSGLLLFGRNSDTVREFYNQIQRREVEKEYLCRVEGDFPDEPVTCHKPIEVLSHKVGICAVSSTGKDCSTEFKKLFSNGKSSVILCKPLTGRMHQIRVHLQYLGYPIVNDPFYNHEVFGPKKGKDGDYGKTKEQLVQEIMKLHTTEKWLGMENNDESSCITCIDEAATNKELFMLKESESKKIFLDFSDHKAYDNLVDRYNFCPEKVTKNPNCPDCKRKYRDPKPSDLIMYLHALRYKGKDWSFETEVPAWAQEDWNL